MEELKKSIQQGIVYEDEFIDMYLKVVRDEGLLYLFGSSQDSAKQLLTQLINDSREHKRILENIINSL